MIEPCGDGYEVQCDTCEEYVEVEAQDIGEAYRLVKEEGWRAYKEGSEWRHSCPGCVEDFANNG